MNPFLTKALLTLVAWAQRHVLQVSMDTWKAACQAVKAADAPPDLTNEVRLDLAQNNLCAEISARVGYDLHPNEITRRLIQAAHWYLRIRANLS